MQKVWIGFPRWYIWQDLESLPIRTRYLTRPLAPLLHCRTRCVCRGRHIDVTGNILVKRFGFLDKGERPELSHDVYRGLRSRRGERSNGSWIPLSLDETLRAYFPLGSMDAPGSPSLRYYFRLALLRLVRGSLGGRTKKIWKPFVVISSLDVSNYNRRI